jgi:hypothetical protein
MTPEIEEVVIETHGVNAEKLLPPLGEYTFDFPARSRRNDALGCRSD